MTRQHNFSAGPAAIHEAVLKKAQAEFLGFNNGRASIIEVSHRSGTFKEVLEQARQSARELLSIPDNYDILFMHGGASAQFFALPLNLLGDKTIMAYINTGAWSKKAIKEAKPHGYIHEIATIDTETPLLKVPQQGELGFFDDAAYLHFTDNETISGVEFNYIPDSGDVPLVCDMSSNIFSRQFDISKFGVVYAGAQKNIGPSGMALVIVRKDLLGKASVTTPSIYNYESQSKSECMVNTPSTFNIYMAGLCFEWLQDQGGISAMEALNKKKSNLLYSIIDEFSDFYHNRVDPLNRSRMNVAFTLNSEELERKFLDEAARRDMVNLKGHRSVGGIRASIYNAVSMESVEALAQLMRDFVKNPS